MTQNRLSEVEVSSWVVCGLATVTTVTGTDTHAGTGASVGIGTSMSFAPGSQPINGRGNSQKQTVEFDSGSQAVLIKR